MTGFIERGEICPLIIQKRQNSVALASMNDWWSSWISAIAAPKHLLIDTDATGLPLGEAVADPGSASSVYKVQDNFIDQDCAYRH